jgi:hypothetical protein
MHVNVMADGNDEYAWNGIMSRARVAGGFTWTGWEYKGEDGGWPSVNSHLCVTFIWGIDAFSDETAAFIVTS